MTVTDAAITSSINYWILIFTLGRFKTDEEIAAYASKSEATRNFFGEGINDRSRAVTRVLDRIAKEKGVSKTGIALAYVMQKVPYVFPIVGGRRSDHLQDNIDALKIVLTEQDMKDLEDPSPIDLGFPFNFM